jgi:acylphosphatase
VFFRQRTARLARAEGCGGWIKNRPDGLVEAVFEGHTEAVDRLIAWCHEGPEQAVVEGVDVVDEEPEGLEGFEVVRA